MPDTITIPDRVRKIVAELLNGDVDRCTDDANLIDDIGADSLDFIELAVTLETEFNATIDDDQVDRWKTVGDVIRDVEAQRT